MFVYKCNVFIIVYEVIIPVHRIGTTTPRYHLSGKNVFHVYVALLGILYRLVS